MQILSLTVNRGRDSSTPLWLPGQLQAAVRLNVYNDASVPSQLAEWAVR